LHEANMSGNEGDRDRAVKETSFEARLRTARDKAGLDAPPPSVSAGGGTGTDPSALSVGLRVGVELVSALVVAVAIGWFLDNWLHTRPAFLIVFVLLGGVAGVMNVWRVIGPKRPTP
jgi:ATP synthase protein I